MNHGRIARILQWPYWVMVGKWAFLTIGLSLAHLWIGVLFDGLRGATTEVLDYLKDGALIFFANTLAVEILRKGWSERTFLLEHGATPRTRRASSFLHEFASPVTVVLVSVTTYCGLLATPSPHGEMFLWIQIITTVLALISGLSQAIIIEQRSQMILAHLREIYLGRSGPA